MLAIDYTVLYCQVRPLEGKKEWSMPLPLSVSACEGWLVWSCIRGTEYTGHRDTETLQNTN